MTFTINPICAAAQKAAALVFLATSLAACVAPPPRSAENLSNPDTVRSERIQEVAVAESQKLLEQQAALLEMMRREAAVKVVEPEPPVFDPLEGKTISVAVSKGNIGQILAALADAGGLNLIVDPDVMRDHTALSDMNLKDVSLREAFNEVLRSYNVAGEVNNQTMRIYRYEEKFFTLGFLNVSSQLNLSSGGNVFGSNIDSGNTAITGSLSMNASANVRADPYTEIESNLNGLLGTGLDKDMERPTQQPTGFTLNRTTGSLYVKAAPDKMRAIERLIQNTQHALSQQVYIEAQLVDVQLSDGYQWGVDFSALRSRLAINFGVQPITMQGSDTATLIGSNGNFPTTSLTIPSRIIGSNSGMAGGGIAYQDKNGSAILNALRSFGNLRVLSNPNIQVRNGTPAMLSVGTSQRYVSRSSSAQNNIGGGATTTSSEVQTDAVFSGVMVGVLPMLRPDGRIELLINPVQSEVDPQSLGLVNVNDYNRVSLPQVSYKGLTTTLNVSDGDVVVVGGLIDQKDSGTNSGLPYVSDVPVLGKLATQESNSKAMRELIIVLRVRLL